MRLSLQAKRIPCRRRRTHASEDGKSPINAPIHGGPPRELHYCHPDAGNRVPASSAKPRTEPQLIDIENIWNRARVDLRSRLSDSTFQMWIDPLRPALLDGRVLVLEAPREVGPWVATKFGPAITEAVSLATGMAAEVRVTYPEGEETSPPGSSTDQRNPRSSDKTAKSGDFSPTLDLNPKLSFDQFVISGSNRLAHAGALAAAEMPAQAYNPLFIYGPPGTGKTHLLHAIGNLARQHSPDMRIRICSAEQFTNGFVDSVRNGEMAGFKRSYRDLDLLLIDDAQFLANKTRTEEEFFHTFNELISSSSQVVITSDRMPADIDSVEQRLRDRFASGLVVDVGSPDLQARVAILAMRARRDGLGEIPKDALEAIAERIKGNVRSLEGALIRVVAYSSLTGSRLSRDLAAQVLDQLYPRETETRRPAAGTTEIKAMVAETFGITVDELESQSRSAKVIWPRQVAMYLAREAAGEPLPQIGASFGGRNHSTVINACKRVNKRISSDPEAAITVRSLKRRILAGDDRVQ